MSTIPTIFYHYVGFQIWHILITRDFNTVGLQIICEEGCIAELIDTRTSKHFFLLAHCCTYCNFLSQCQSFETSIYCKMLILFSTIWISFLKVLCAFAYLVLEIEGETKNTVIRYFHHNQISAFDCSQSRVVENIIDDWF